MDTKETVLIWLHRDLRLSDNQLFDQLNPALHRVLCLYLLPKAEAISVYRRKFLIESLDEFSKQIQKIGLELTVIEENEESPLHIQKILDMNEVDEVRISRRYNTRDVKLITEIQGTANDGERQRMQHLRWLTFEQSTLYNENELPFSVENLPSPFTAFRKKVESECQVSKPYSTPVQNFHTDSVSSPAKLQLPPEATKIDLQLALERLRTVDLPYGFKGGELAARHHLHDYIWEQRSILNYKDTRNGMIDKYDSTKLSPWLSLGCLSARQVFEEVSDFESQIEKNESTYWVYFELLWRDYFKFYSLQIQDHLFYSRSDYGLSNSDNFENWKNGQTDEPFVNANMIEILKTGWMSNRGRQNVASYMSKTMGLNWVDGAAYFEGQLIDSDVESNWGNWRYVAGVGTDPRDRVFNVQRQAQMYDPQGEYQRLWLDRGSR